MGFINACISITLETLLCFSAVKGLTFLRFPLPQTRRDLLKMVPIVVVFFIPIIGYAVPVVV